MTPRLRLLLCCLAVTVPAVPAAIAQTVTGGASAPDDTTLARATCGTGDEWSCGRGQRLTLEGTGMDGVEAVVFLGGKGNRDDRRSEPVRSERDALVVFVPDNARSGRLRLLTYGDERIQSARPLTVRPGASKANPDDASPSADGVFPIAGPHDMGQTATNNFGGGRGHKGQDMFAACGTRVAAARGGTVKFAGYHSAAGNYVVIDGAGTDVDYVYMHMRDAPLVRTSQRVFTGQQLGVVGETGRATGCHLHFELWSGPGWYDGGAAFDPLPSLRAWDAYS